VVAWRGRPALCGGEAGPLGARGVRGGSPEKEARSISMGKTAYKIRQQKSDNMAALLERGMEGNDMKGEYMRLYSTNVLGH